MKMRKVNFRMNEKLKYETIKELVDHKGNKNRAAQKLLKKKKINLAMLEEQINTIVNHAVALEDSHPRCEKPKYFGEIIEQDGSIYLWFKLQLYHQNNMYIFLISLLYNYLYKIYRLNYIYFCFYP